MRFLPAKFVSLVICLPLFGQDLKAVIDAPAKSDPGDLVILDAAKSVGAKAFAWALPGSTKTFLPVDGGVRCVFACGSAGRYTFVLAVAAGDKVAVATHTIEIGGLPAPPAPGPSPPTPGPGPDPAPNPPPQPEPDGQYGLRQSVIDSYKLVSPRPANETRLIAKNFRTTAAKIAAGTLKTPGEAVLDVRAANRESLGESVAAWYQFFLSITKSLDAIDPQLKKPVRETRAMFAEIAAALEEIAK